LYHSKELVGYKLTDVSPKITISTFFHFQETIVIKHGTSFDVH